MRAERGGLVDLSELFIQNLAADKVQDDGDGQKDHQDDKGALTREDQREKEVDGVEAVPQKCENHKVRTVFGWAGYQDAEKSPWEEVESLDVLDQRELSGDIDSEPPEEASRDFGTVGMARSIWRWHAGTVRCGTQVVTVGWSRGPSTARPVGRFAQDRGFLGGRADALVAAFRCWCGSAIEPMAATWGRGALWA
jgi:hypothetical protein